MTNKTIIAGLVAIAFVAGSMMTVTADAKKDDKHFTEFFELLMILETQIISMQTEIIALSAGGTGGGSGETGDKGPDGDSAPLSIYTVHNDGVNNSWARCTEGDIVTGGGGNAVGGIVATVPTDDNGGGILSGEPGVGWRTFAVVSSATVTSWAICTTP